MRSLTVAALLALRTGDDVHTITPMLILFDIDGTILTSRSEVNDGGSRDGVGAASMIEAGRHLYGPHFTLDGVEIAGRLDVLIWRDVAKRYGISETDAEHQRFREEYAQRLQSRLNNGAQVRLLPGVGELVEELARIESVTLGLLTGNYPETGRMKLEAAGLNPSLFVVGAWGCDGASRRDLPPIAMRAHRDLCGTEIACERVVIIGDTPHDVDCAQAHGCRALGVATGSFSTDALAACGADLVLADLSETPVVVRWLLNGECAVAEPRP